MYKIGWDQFMPFMATVVGILATDLLKGIGIGMVVAIFYILRTNYRRTYKYKTENNHEGEVLKLKLSEAVTFLNKASIQNSLEQIPQNSKVVIDGSNSVDIDHDVLEIIEDFKKHRAPGKNIKVETIGIREVEVASH